MRKPLLWPRVVFSLYAMAAVTTGLTFDQFDKFRCRNESPIVYWAAGLVWPVIGLIEVDSYLFQLDLLQSDCH